MGVTSIEIGGKFEMGEFQIVRFIGKENSSFELGETFKKLDSLFSDMHWHVHKFH